MSTSSRGMGKDNLMQPRYFALIQMPSSEVPRTLHYSGLPVAEDTGKPSRGKLPIANVVVIEQEVDGSAAVNRYTADGEFAGDTWHPSLDEAFEQVGFEFGEGLGLVQVIPDGVKDAKGYALARARRP
jgi:hypothetical protein